MSNKAVNVSKKDVFAVHNGFFYDNRLSFEEIGLLEIGRASCRERV